MIKWDDTLIDAIARRRVVIVLGAGVSSNAKNTDGKSPKKWKDLLEGYKSLVSRGKKTVIQKLIDQDNYLTACEVIKSCLESDKYIRELEAEYQNARYEPAKIHEHIFNLDSRLIITPNIGNIYETYATTITHGDVKIKTYKDSDIIDCIRKYSYLIIKMHGSINSPTDLIFTHKEYSNARIAYSQFYQIMSALALTNTFFFIGCGQNDPDIRLLFEDQFLRYPTTIRHYFTITKDYSKTDESVIFANTMNIKYVEYSGKDNHKELTDSLGELVDLVKERRGILASANSW